MGKGRFVPEQSWVYPATIGDSEYEKAPGRFRADQLRESLREFGLIPCSHSRAWALPVAEPGKFFLPASVASRPEISAPAKLKRDTRRHLRVRCVACSSGKWYGAGHAPAAQVICAAAGPFYFFSACSLTSLCEYALAAGPFWLAAPLLALVCAACFWLFLGDLSPMGWRVAAMREGVNGISRHGQAFFSFIWASGRWDPPPLELNSPPAIDKGALVS